jgi:hypothetical protein
VPQRAYPSFNLKEISQLPKGHVFSIQAINNAKLKNTHDITKLMSESLKINKFRANKTSVLHKFLYSKENPSLGGVEYI